MQCSFFEFSVMKWYYDHVAGVIQKYHVASFLTVEAETKIFNENLLQCQRLYHKPRRILSL